MRTREDVIEAFTYHPPRSEAEKAFYEDFRDQARELALYLVAAIPESAERTLALRKLHECVMQANAAVAIHGLGEKDA